MEKEFIYEALKLAKLAERKGEVPIGAVVVRNGKIIARGYNLRQKKRDATLHAEMVAIKKACKVVKDWRLNDCTLYVTLEPCLMCAGAIFNARIGKVVFGAYDKNSGCFGGKCDLSKENMLNANIEVVGGVLQEDCEKIITDFFKKARQRNKK